MDKNELAKLKPRGPLCLVKRVKIAEPKTATGIYMPNANDYQLSKFEILQAGDNVLDLKTGDIVLAEDTFTQLSKSEKEIGLLHEKYIHLIYGN